MITEKLQWHPAFSAALRIEFEENLDDLDFKDEYQLSKKPMQMDILVIKKDNNVSIKKNIGHIFRTHNIIEYKSPDDSLNMNDFYKVYGYTCFYQSDTEKVKEIPPEEITITFVCGHYPRKMIQHLKAARKIEIEKYGDGIYYLKGDEFPIQLLITTQLSKEHNYWLQHLRSNLETGEEIQNLVERYELKKHSKNHQAVMDLIVRANWEKIKEEKTMCDALNELFADELAESKERGIQEGLAQGIKQGIEQGIERGIERGTAIGKADGEKRKLIQQVCKKLAKGKALTAIADDLEEDISVIEEIYTATVPFAPDYDLDLIYEHLKL